MRLSLNHILVFAFATSALAQESPYFVTYDHHMEEPHRLEIGFEPLVAAPKQANRFTATTLEVEFAPRAWWTSAVYFDGQSTAHESTLFTGWRVENRLRLLMQEHAINPVLYLEYANVTGADKTLREFVGFDSWRDVTKPNSEAHRERNRELETKLILSGNRGGWNVASNLIAEKNLAGNPWEFGYAVGVSRPLALAATPQRCTFCPENFSAGVEAYGGLGEQRTITVRNTSHYIAPVTTWAMPSGVTLKMSPVFGIGPASSRFLMRFGIGYEIALR